MRLGQFLDKQPLDVIQWNEPELDILAYRYPMLDMEIKTGARLIVRESEVAVFVDQGHIVGFFGPGLYTLTAVNLPLLAELESRHAGFESPFETDLYFFSTHLVNDEKWGTSTPTYAGDDESVSMRLRSYGIYSYRLTDPRTFFARVSGARESYSVYDLDDRLRNTIVARMTDAVAASGLSYLDLAADQAALNGKVAEQVKPAFAALGLELTEFSMQNISLPSDLQRSFDQPDGLIVDAVGSLIDTKSCIDCSCCGAPMRTDGDKLKCDFCHNVLAPQAGNDAGGAAAQSGGRACPVCSIELMQATIGSASLLYCTRCDGMLVAMEQLETLVAASRALPGGPIPLWPGHPAQLRQRIACPECRRSMEAQAYVGAGQVAIDTCEHCGLNWLDHGELARIAHPPASDFVAESNAADCSNDGDSYFAGPQAAQVVEYNNL